MLFMMSLMVRLLVFLQLSCLCFKLLLHLSHLLVELLIGMLFQFLLHLFFHRDHLVLGILLSSMLFVLYWLDLLLLLLNILKAFLNKFLSLLLVPTVKSIS
jgi:hypothetical protein